MPDLLAHSLASLTRRLTARPEADAALLARYRAANDPAAFAELVRRHGPMVLGVCRRMLGQAHDADDAFQATFLVLARGARSVRNPGALPAWLYGTAVRVCRKARARRVAPMPPAAGASSGADPFAEVAWKEVCGLLDEELGRLPAALREPLLLCYFNGLTRDEAAERLGWSRRTLMRRLEQARARLRRRLERRGLGKLGVGAAVLSPGGLAALVPDALAAAAVGVGTGGPVPPGVGALAGGATVRLLHVVAGLALALVLAGGGLGLAALPSPPDTSPPTAAASEDTSLPPGKARHRDADGVPLPAGAVHRLGSRRFRVEGISKFLLPTPDGKHLLVHPEPRLSAYPAQGLMLLDADTGLRVRSFEDGRRVPKGQAYEAIRPAAFSPDGKKLYALGWHKAEEAGPRLYVWASFHNPCRRVLLVWDVATGRRTAEWDLPAGGALGASLLGVSVPPDGQRLYVYGAIRMGITPDRHIRDEQHGVHVLDAATGKRLQTWEGAGCPAGVTAGGKELITFRDGAEITAHDVQTGKPVRIFPLAGFVPSVALSPDGQTVAAVGVKGERDRVTACEVKLWEAATGREIRRLTADAKAVRSSRARLAFAADGQTLFLSTGSGRVLRWGLADGRPLADWPAHSGIVADLCLRPGRNELLSVGEHDGMVRRWDAATGKALSATDAYVGEMTIDRAPDGRAAAVGDATGRVDVWDVTTGRVTRALRLPAARNRGLTFSPDGRALLDATDDGKITVRDPATGKAVHEILAAGGGLWDATFSPDGRRLLTSRNNQTRLLSWPEGRVVWESAEACVAAFSPDGGRMVSGNWNVKTFLRDPRSGAVLAEVPGESMAAAAFSADGRRLVTGHLYGPWRVRNGTDGAVLKTVNAFQHVFGVAFSPSGWLLGVAGDRTVRVYDTASWQEVARCDGHDGTVRTVFFGPDDATLVSASAEDGTALVWSLKPPAGREPPDPARLWADLSGDGPAVRRAVWAAARHPDVAVPLFRQKWPVPEHPIDAGRVGKLIAGLDSDTFAEREAAEAELVKVGRPAEAALRKALAESPSAEVKRRARTVLGPPRPPSTRPRRPASCGRCGPWSCPARRRRKGCSKRGRRRRWGSDSARRRPPP
jgi:RNA polymerase sigma factor (sigma-70 family)